MNARLKCAHNPKHENARPRMDHFRIQLAFAQYAAAACRCSNDDMTQTIRAVAAHFGVVKRFGRAAGNRSLVNAVPAFGLMAAIMKSIKARTFAAGR